MKRALARAEEAGQLLARHPTLILTWWVFSLPLMAAGHALARRALERGLPGESIELLQLLLWACLLVLGWAWYLLGVVFLHQQADAVVLGSPLPRLPSPRKLLDRFPACASAHAARTALSLVAALPLGAGLPLVRVISCSWPARAALGHPRAIGLARGRPGLELGVLQVCSWLLLALTSLNMAVLVAWVTLGSLLDAPALLPQLSDPRLWAVAVLLSASLVEPWRALALTLHLEARPSSETPPTGGSEC
jgi:hypothetical protein